MNLVWRVPTDDRRPHALANHWKSARMRSTLLATSCLLSSLTSSSSTERRLSDRALSCGRAIGGRVRVSGQLGGLPSHGPAMDGTCLTEPFGDRNSSRMEEAQARELMMEFASYAFAVGNLRTVFERSGTFDQFRSHLEQDAARNELFRDSLQVLDWVEASHSQQKSLLEIGLAEHELLLVRPVVPMLLMRFFASATSAESGQLNAFVESLDPAAPGPYGELSSRVLKLLESATNMLDAATDVLRDNPDLRM